jgi:hypothetical protein
MMRIAGKYLALPALCWVFFNQSASAADCRWFGRDAQKAIKTHVAALQRLEFEASDRLKGLDTRPFPMLRDDAKRTAAIVIDPAAIKDEEGLKRCRNATWPIRKICADAAEAFVVILDKHVVTEKAEYDKAAYASAMAACEKHMDLKPLKSLIRGNL